MGLDMAVVSFHVGVSPVGRFSSGLRLAQNHWSVGSLGPVTLGLVGP